MHKKSFRWLAVAGALASLGLMGQAKADWAFTGSYSGLQDKNGNGTGSTVQSSITLSVGGAYAANGGTLSGATAAGTNSTSCSGCTAINSGNVNNTWGINGFASGATWSTNTKANLSTYTGGLGMASDSANINTVPNHAIDNGPATNASHLITGVGNTEAVLLNFSSSVVLSSIGIGYNGTNGTNGDTDISVFRWVGTGAEPTMTSLNGTGASLTAMAAAGWELVGNYANLVNDTTSPYNSVNGGNKGSSWWMISAYNTAFGAGSGLDQGDDYFKIYAVAGSACTAQGPQCGNIPGVPEPASLALFGIAALGAGAARRRARA